MLEQEFNVISGITDLIVTHTGAEPCEQLYIDGLEQAGNQAYAATSKGQVPPVWGGWGLGRHQQPLRQRELDLPLAHG